MSYLSKKYVSKFLSDKNVKHAEEIFGDLKHFDNTKVIHSHSTCLHNGNLYQINNHIESPKCYEDMWAFNFLRSFAETIVTSGKILRLEQKPFDSETVEKLEV